MKNTIISLYTNDYLSTREIANLKHSDIKVSKDGALWVTLLGELQELTNESTNEIKRYYKETEQTNNKKLFLSERRVRDITKPYSEDVKTKRENVRNDIIKFIRSKSGSPLRVYLRELYKKWINDEIKLPAIILYWARQSIMQSLKEKSFVYLIQDEIGRTKIGKADNVKKRLSQLQEANPLKLKIIHTIECKSPAEAYQLESTLHEKYGDKNIIREWYKLSESDIEEICKN